MARNDLADIRTRALSLADFQPNGFISKDDIDSWINDSCEALYGKMIEKDQFRFEAEHPISIVAGTSDYPLPARFYKLNGVDIRLNASDEWCTITPYVNAERNRFNQRRVWNLRDRDAIRYQLRGSVVRLTPTPSGAYSGRLLYVPTLAQLEDDSDTVPAGFPPAFVRWVVHDVAVKCKIKAEDDAAAIALDRDSIGASLLSEMKERTLDEPMYIADVRGAVPRNYDDDEEWL